MDNLIKWIWKIFTAVIIVSLVMNILPSDKYKKYVKYISGIIISILCFSPVIKILNKDFNIDKLWEQAFYNDNEYNEKNQLKEILKKTQEYKDVSLKNNYEKILTEEIERNSSEHGFDNITANVSIEDNEKNKDYGKITKISINTLNNSNREDTEKVKKYKEYLSGYYNVDVRNIKIK